MSQTLTLHYDRFVVQVSTGSPRIKSNYRDMMAENFAAMRGPHIPWRASTETVGSVTDHDFSASTQFNDKYDAFKLTGNYDPSAMTEIAYAGMVAYRFKIPADALSRSVAVTSVKIPASRDRFEKSGLRIVAALSTASAPAQNFRVVRGEYGSSVVQRAVMAQSDVPYLTASAPASEDVVLTFGTPDVRAYLFVYVSLEDYSDTWERYNAREQRLYAIEGSGAIAGERVEVTFAGDVTADEETYTHGRKVFSGLTEGRDFAQGDVPLFYHWPDGMESYARKISVKHVDVHGVFGDYIPRLYSAMSAAVFSRWETGQGVVVEQPVVSGADCDSAAVFPFAKLERTSVPDPDMEGQVISLSLTLECHPAVLPFVAPSDWFARAIRFRLLTGSSAFSPGCSIAMWLARNSYIPVVTADLAKRDELYYGSEASGFEFLGRIDTADYDATIKIPALDRGTVSTLMFFPCVKQPDDIVSLTAWITGLDGLENSSEITLLG